jgi:hypothetical protein
MGTGSLIRAGAVMAFLFVTKHRARLLAWFRDPDPTALRARHALTLFIAVLVLLQTISIWSLGAAERRLTDRDRDWISLVDWVREQGVPGPVLVPIDRTLETYQLHLHAKVPVWVDSKQGAAVMWKPSFHSTWSIRFDAVRKLRDDEDFAKYAQENGIPTFVVPQCHCPEGIQALYSNDHFALCRSQRAGPVAAISGAIEN